MSGGLYTHVRYFNTTGPCVPDLHYMKDHDAGRVGAGHHRRRSASGAAVLL